jgi:hypothetical protein
MAAEPREIRWPIGKGQIGSRHTPNEKSPIRDLTAASLFCRGARDSPSSAPIMPRQSHFLFTALATASRRIIARPNLSVCSSVEEAIWTSTSFVDNYRLPDNTDQVVNSKNGARHAASRTFRKSAIV